MVTRTTHKTEGGRDQSLRGYQGCEDSEGEDDPND